jgi:4-aminobutyrate aminotransferase-like enzyme
MVNSRSLLQRRIRVLGAQAPLFYDTPLHAIRGEGVWLIGADGRRYLDAYNNVPHVGHCHPRVVEAICRQARMLNTHTRYLDETIVRYAERLTATFNPDLSTAMFCCSGSEANELALRIARGCTGGSGILVTDYSYHGNTAAMFEVSTAYTPPAERSTSIRTFPAPDPYRDRTGEDDTALARRYAREVKKQIEKLTTDGVKLAALLVCTAFSSEGLPRSLPGFMAEAIEHVHSAGGLFIADEVQAGFGRFGECMWGYESLGATPDIVTMGKPMGNGHPLAGVVAKRELIENFGRRSMYFNTFGGNPVSCAAGLAVLDVLADERLLEHAQQVGTYLVGALRKLQDRHEAIGDVRGKGLFIGVDLVVDRRTKAPCEEIAKRVVNAMRDRGVLIGRTGPGGNVLKIRPPMPFSQGNADQLVQTLNDVLFNPRLSAD